MCIWAKFNANNSILSIKPALNILVETLQSCGEVNRRTEPGARNSIN